MKPSMFEDLAKKEKEGIKDYILAILLGSVMGLVIGILFSFVTSNNF
jgi:hypothetical protein